LQFFAGLHKFERFRARYFPPVHDSLSITVGGLVYMSARIVISKVSGAYIMTAMDLQLERIKNSIKTIPDYPKPGIFFRDITSLLEQPEAYAASIRLLADRYRDKGLTKVVGTEARGFLFGAPVALALGLGFVPVRKPGKLPRETLSESYELEYGVDMLEIHQDAIKPGDKVLVVDDLLATGGTIEATVKLIRRLGGEVHDAAFVINLADLGGEERLKRMAVESYSLVVFPGH
jgi:adenine phosphoribosyltransferase